MYMAEMFYRMRKERDLSFNISEVSSSRVIPQIVYIKVCLQVLGSTPASVKK